MVISQRMIKKRKDNCSALNEFWFKKDEFWVGEN